MLPDWAPNLHPLIVHFPISLLVAAGIVDAIGLFWRTSRGILVGAVVLYAAGALGALASYLTGIRAAESIPVPTEAVSVLNTHQDLALYTLLFFGTYAAARIALLILKRDPVLLLRFTVVIVGIGGQLLVWQTAEHGGRLVFEFGVGVAPVQELDEELRMLRRQQDATQSALEPLDGGGFRWLIGPSAADAFAEHFRFVDGSAEDIRVSVADGDDGHVLVLEALAAPVMVVAGEDLEGVDVEVELDPSSLTGSVELVHNVNGPQSYHYVRLADTAQLGRVVEGRDDVMAGGAVFRRQGTSDSAVRGSAADESATDQSARDESATDQSATDESAADQSDLPAAGEIARGDAAAGEIARGDAAAGDSMIGESAYAGDWVVLRATADRGHFYGYVDGATIGHGHSAHPAPGPVGLRIDGEGTVRLRRIEVRPIN